MTAAIVARDVSVVLDDDTAVLTSLSFELEPGKITGLIGPSGCGKTTLIRSLAGRQRLRAGALSLLNEAAGAPTLRGRVAYMPQTSAIYTDLSVRDNMRYFAVMRGIGKPDTAVTQALRQVDLSAQAHQMVGTLSGGQRQRVSLGIALLGAPKVLLLDEPTVGLDPLLREALWSLMRELAASGTTIVISSHVMDEASRCDDLLLLRAGHLLAHDSPTVLCHRTASPSIERAFIKLVGTA